MGVGTNWAQGDSLWSMTKKLLDGFNSGAFVGSGGGGGGGGGGAVTVADGADVTLGAKADVLAPSPTGSFSVISMLKGILNVEGLIYSVITSVPAVLATQPTAANLNATVAQPTAANLNCTVVQGTAANLKVDLSGTGANATALKVDGSAVTQPVSGNVGGLTFSIQINPTISTSAYTAGFVVGGIQTLTNAFTAKHTGILESVTLLDKSAQNAPMDLLVFQVTPAAATTADHGAFAWSTDNLNLIARVSIGAGDYVIIKSQSVAMKTGLGIAVKGSGTGLFVVAVTSGTPTYAGANDLQWTWGILQD